MLEKQTPNETDDAQVMPADGEETASSEKSKTTADVGDTPKRSGFTIGTSLIGVDPL